MFYKKAILKNFCDIHRKTGLQHRCFTITYRWTPILKNNIWKQLLLFLPFICELKEVAAMNTSFSLSIITPCPTQNAMRLRIEVLLRFIVSEISFRVHSSKWTYKELKYQLNELLEDVLFFSCTIFMELQQNLHVSMKELNYMEEKGKEAPTRKCS